MLFTLRLLPHQTWRLRLLLSSKLLRHLLLRKLLRPLLPHQLLLLSQLLLTSALRLLQWDVWSLNVSSFPRRRFLTSTSLLISKWTKFCLSERSSTSPQLPRSQSTTSSWRYVRSAGGNNNNLPLTWLGLIFFFNQLRPQLWLFATCRVWTHSGMVTTFVSSRTPTSLSLSPLKQDSSHRSSLLLRLSDSPESPRRPRNSLRRLAPRLSHRMSIK